MFSSCSEETKTVLYNLSIDNTEGGDVLGMQGDITEGSVIEYMAVPKQTDYFTYVFDMWYIQTDQGVTESRDNPLNLTIDDKIRLVPVFKLSSIDEDEIYSEIETFNFTSILEGFIKDAKRHGVDLSHVDFEKSGMEIKPAGYGAAAGYHWDPNIAYVYIGYDIWNERDKDPVELKSKIIRLFWHELGHSILGLDHTCKGGQIMSGRHTPCQGPNGDIPFTTLWNLRFNDRDLNNNFQRSVDDMFFQIGQYFLPGRTTFTSKLFPNSNKNIIICNYLLR